MSNKFADIAFTPTVKKVQEAHGSRSAYARGEQVQVPFNQLLTASEASFIADRDSVYIATVGETGWPYIQHRGGPKGFVRVLGERTLGFADFRGNRQYVSVGNLLTDDRVSMFSWTTRTRRDSNCLAERGPSAQMTSKPLGNSRRPVTGQRWNAGF